MKTVDVHRSGDSARIARARVANNAWTRFWGLMGRRSLAEGEALLIDPCYSVHTTFMRFAIDVVYLDSNDRVLKVVDSLKPFRASICRGAKRVLEMPAGSAALARIRPEDQLAYAEAEKSSSAGA